MATSRRKRTPRPGATPPLGRRPSGPGAKLGSQAPDLRRTFLFPLVLTLGLLILSLAPRVADNARLTFAFLAAVAGLLIWQGILFARLSRAGASRGFRVVLRPQHYLQALVQLTVFAVWGWYWRPVYDFAGLLLAQLIFAYAFDMLLAWSRGERYVLGFGPFPIIFSTNLFLWFTDDWFYLQFLMVAAGFLGKAFVQWRREGRRTHIFNPSAFSLGLFSLVLIATGTSDLTWGQDIATTLTFVPAIYLLLFGLGLVVMYFFRVTLVSGLAAAALFGLSALYGAATGVPYFIDSEIPAAVFLGLHLLVTDPSTSPRTRTGKAIFGALYGAGVFGLFWFLEAVGAPTFYDKLLCVPLLNLSVPLIDRFVRSLQSRPRIRRLTEVPWATANLVHMAVWTTLFAAMTATGRTDGPHRGDMLPFWQEACEEGRAGACERLVQIEASYCADNSGWACNELGAHYVEGRIVEPDAELALGFFARACEAQFQAGCVNLLDPSVVSRAPPRPLDLRLLLRQGGLNLIDTPEPALYERACSHGWQFACERLGMEVR
ncbi:MAG: RnfABCDGE type electron transport complex subunit D [Gammaproteobacteria bacterium]|nr:RnfABCDGE type electron transport complex subunit D [Gammaproteobacteria bacterium]